MKKASRKRKERGRESKTLNKFKGETHMCKASVKTTLFLPQSFHPEYHLNVGNIGYDI